MYRASPQDSSVSEQPKSHNDSAHHLALTLFGDLTRRLVQVVFHPYPGQLRCDVY